MQRRVECSQRLSMLVRKLGARGDVVRRAEAFVRSVSASFLAVLVASVVAEDVSHRLGRNAEEVRAAFSRQTLLIDKLEIRLVNQCRRVERKVAVPCISLVMSENAELLVDEREQLIERAAIAPLNRLE